ncbi:MAG: PilT/PilU family type 4a pilus ATPase [Actinobacteria bacterium]|nr:PilT/PilU family type 4a pilus ATPase [Actinomycetota bacterium]
MDEADLNRWLAALAELDGSDLHIKSGSPPRLRVNGQLGVLRDEAELKAEDAETIAAQVMSPKASDAFAERMEVDFAYSVSGLGRFRVNAYRQRGTVAMAFRRIRQSSASIEELGLPQVVARLADEQRGMVLVTGPTGSGKSTTLATMIDRINHSRACHVITIEDPIEFLHRDHLATIDQREVGLDTSSFHSAMRVVLRQDPDVILVGEMRDQETVHAAITAAETGHLVFSTLHTTNATETINRVVDFFPPHQQKQVRVSLAGSLKGTIGQRLVATADGKGRVPAVEAMVVNGRIQQCITDPDKTSDIEEIIATGEYYGMKTFDQSLADLIAEHKVDLRNAMSAASNPHDLRVLLERRGVLKTGQRA